MASLGVAVLALLVAATAVACLAVPASSGAVDFGGLDALVARSGGSKVACLGAAVGECGVDEDEELGLGGGASEALRRTLAQRQPTNRYISYAALRADQVPCNQRGKSYYTNCASQKPANPYRRGCSAITRCQRNTN
ncbi:rapid alkalinization factor-like [Phragmites australis]|uniref:rapid alkalinization factor-like n=1 Tax=Phragmites australis TaxID=29695 RepID=UPI002D790B2B|nr:rapid alkalinization factor-like [Phragmites australis]